MMGKKGKIFAGLIAGAAAIVAVKNKDKIVEKMNRPKEEKEGILLFKQYNIASFISSSFISFISET